MNVDCEDYAGMPAKNDNAAYIYHLLKDGDVIYVGQSTSLRSRIFQHKYNRVVFDSVYFYEVEDNISIKNNQEAYDIVEYQ